MAWLDKIQIRGIRSFDPTSEAHGTLVFQKPLTIIVGPNGTGKTTIVESLKFATTGELPPGARAGQAGQFFVHDPKVAHADVRASVKLYFRDTANKEVTVTRNLKSSLKNNGKTECRSEGGIIARKDPKTGEPKSLDSKIADINQEVMVSLGVPKCILSHVVFCHQEEANWPLGEAKALKEKFDDIFAATKYTKLMKSMSDQQKEIANEVKGMRKELEHLQKDRTRAAEFEKQKESIETEVAEKKETIEKLKTELEPLESQVQRLNLRMAEMQGIYTEIVSMRTKQGTEEERVQKLLQTISNPFEGSKDELRRKISEFESETSRSSRDIEKVERRIDSLESDATKLDKEKNGLIQKIGSYEADATTHKSREDTRNMKIGSLATEYGISGFDRRTSFEPVAVRRFEELFNQKMREAEQAGKKEELAMEAKMADTQKEMNEARSKVASLQENIRIKQAEAAKNDAELENIKKEAAEIKDSQSKLSVLEQKQKRVERSLEEKDSAFNEENTKKEIENSKQERSLKDDELKTLQNEMKQAQQELEKRSKLTMLKENREGKLATCGKHIETHKDTLIELFGSVPTENLKRLYDDRKTAVATDKKKAGEELRKLENQLLSLEHGQATGSDKLEEKKRELDKCEARMNKAVGGDDLESRMSEIDKNLELFRNEKGAIDGGKYMMEKYITELEKTKPCCPLCSRGFDAEQDAKNLIKKLEEKIERFPDTARKLDKKITAEDEKRSILLDLRPVAKRIAELNIEIPKLESDCKLQKSEISILEDKIRQSELTTDKLGRESLRLQEMESDVAFVEKYREEMEDLDMEISLVKNGLSSGCRSIDALQEDIESVQGMIENLNKRIESKTERLAKHRSDMEDLRSRLNQVKGEQLDIRSKLEKHQHSEQRIRNLKAQVQEFRSEALANERKITPLKDSVSHIQAQLDRISADKETMTRSNYEKTSSMKQQLSEIRSLNAEIRKYEEQGKEEALSKAKKRKLEIETELNVIGEDRQREMKMKQELSDRMKNGESKKRELDDCMELKKLEESLESRARLMEEKQETLGDFDPHTSERRRQELNKEIDELKERKNYANGAYVKLKQALQDKIDSLKTYENTERDFKLLLIDTVTIEQAKVDLKKYCIAMDHAIMRYHSEKMEEINKNLLRLWHSVYRNYDIEAVRIVSEGDTGASSGSRKVYNYRVVMDKKGIGMDMRGRCSAGQKVLASILIRIALAEVFCLTCGVLTLDEPTTNLDSENMMYLAKALGTLLSNRQEQQNFQLILISHDEDFLRHLWNECRPDYFYSVQKSDEGYSQLRRHQDFDEIRHD